MVTPIRIAPCWQIVEPGQPAEAGIPIALEPGVGFGDGSHPTTRLCLQALSALAPRDAAGGFRMLDFGSGSGILAIGAARLGARVEAVEIDGESIAHARRNIALNQVEDRVRVRPTLDEVPGPFDFVVANILRPVLVEFADRLAARLVPGGTLVLSGLVSTDVPEVSVRYQKFFENRRPEIYQSGDWRALLFRARRSCSKKPA